MGLHTRGHQTKSARNHLQVQIFHQFLKSNSEAPLSLQNGPDSFSLSEMINMAVLPAVTIKFNFQHP